MPAEFENFGISFQYPDNWSMEESPSDFDEQSPASGQGKEVAVSSPQTAFWHLCQYPGEANLESLFDEALGALRSDYKAIEVEAADEIVEGQPLKGYDVNFFYLDLTNTCWLRGFSTEDATYLLSCQAEDQEFEQVKGVFRAMLISVLRSLE